MKKEGLLFFRKKMEENPITAKRPASPSPCDSNPRSNKITDFDKRLLVALDARDAKFQKEQAEHKKRLFAPLERPTNAYVQNTIIPGIQAAIAKSDAKDTFKIVVGFCQPDSYLAFLSDVSSRDLYPWTDEIDTWRARCFSNAVSESERQSVSEHVIHGTIMYLRTIVEQWNHHHSVVHMTLLERKDDACRIFYSFQIDIKRVFV